MCVRSVWSGPKKAHSSGVLKPSGTEGRNNVREARERERAAAAKAKQEREARERAEREARRVAEATEAELKVFLSILVRGTRYSNGFIFYFKFTNIKKFT
jgi:hypothetical protein